MAFGAESRMRSNVRADIHDGQGLKGSISRPDTEAQDQLLQIIIFGLQRAAGPYRWATFRHSPPHALIWRLEATKAKPPEAAASVAPR